MVSDESIIEGLIAHDNFITEDFFFDKCRGLFCSIINKVFDYDVDYDEFVNELYAYLMENDAARLRSFDYRSSVYQWLKVTAIRYFMKKREQLIEERSKETHYEKDQENQSAQDSCYPASDDLQRLFESMPNRRYAYVIRSLMIEDRDPDALAQEMNVTKANLYNIKKRALAQLTHVALKDIEEYGRQ